MGSINHDLDHAATYSMKLAKEVEEFNAYGPFDLRSLSFHLPHKRKGLSKYYSGKSRTFRSLAEAKRIEDIPKMDHVPSAKRRKYSGFGFCDNLL